MSGARGKGFGIVAAVLLVALVCSRQARACVGARPMAMGGAFVAAAQGWPSVYWNPAGAAIGEAWSSMCTLTLNNRLSYNYDLYAAAAGPVGDEGDLGIGAGYVLSTLALGNGVAREDWTVLSVARRASDSLALGANIRLERASRTNASGTSDAEVSELTLDLGVLVQVSRIITAGLLVQDLPVGSATPANIRPGLSVRPDPKSLITMEVYDLTGSWAKPTGRIGYERWITPWMALRAGYYGFGLELGGSWKRGAPTWGAGLAAGPLRVDYAFLGGYLGNTHQLGVGFAF